MSVYASNQTNVTPENGSMAQRRLLKKYAPLIVYSSRLVAIGSPHNLASLGGTPLPSQGACRSTWAEMDDRLDP